MGIPELPAKRYVGLLSSDFILERRRQLQDYLDELLAHASLAHSPPVLHFLQVSAAPPPVPAPPPACRAASFPAGRRPANLRGR